MAKPKDPNAEKLKTGQAPVEIVAPAAVGAQEQIEHNAKTERTALRGVGQRTEIVETLQKGIRDMRIAQEYAKERKEKIRDYWSSKTSGISSMEAKHYEFCILNILELPLEAIETDWKNNIQYYYNEKKRELSSAEVDGYKRKIEERMKTAIKYVEMMSYETGFITTETLSKMIHDQNMRANEYVAALAKPAYEDIGEAFMSVLGVKKDEAKVKEVVEKYLTNGNEEAFPFIMTVLSMMSRNDRINLLSELITKNKNIDDKSLIKKINASAALSPDEMQLVLAEQYKDFSEEEKQQFYLNYKVHNQYIQKAQKIAHDSYGVRNDAAVLLSPGSLLMFAGKVVAGATVVTGTLVNLIKGDGLRNPLSLLKNEPIVGGTVAFAALDQLGDIENARATFQGKEGREQTANRKSYVMLRREMATNEFWPQWQKFFSLNEFAAGKAFRDYLREMIRVSGGETLPKENVTIYSFRQYLLDQAALPVDRRAKNLNYKKMVEDLDGGVRAGDFGNLPEIFDQLKFNNVKELDQAIEQTKTL